MEEKDILLLEGLGYTVSGGFILDSNGNYLESVDYEGTKINSMNSREDYNALIQKNQKLESIGFQPNPESIDNVETQQEIALAKENIKKYANDPTSVKTPPFDGNYIYEKAFEEYQKEDKKINGGTFPNPQSMQESVEEDTILADFDTPEAKESFKEIENRIKKIESIDPSTGVRAREFIDETNKELEENAWYNPMNIGLHVSNILDKAVDFVSPTGSGMKDEKLKAEYKDLLDKKKQLLKPVASNKIQQIDETLSQLQPQIDAYWEIMNSGSVLGGSNPERDAAWKDEKKIEKFQYAVRKLEKQKNSLQDFIEDKNYDTSIFTLEKGLDVGTIGLLDLSDKLIYELPVINKIENKEELDEGDQAVVNSIIAEQKVAEQGFEQNFWHEVTGGAVESAKFMIGMGIGRSASKGATEAIRTSIKGKLGQITAGITDIAFQSALHPGTYNTAVDRYMGDLDIRQDEDGNNVLSVRQDAYDLMQEEADIQIDKLEEQKELSTSPEDRKKINDEIENIERRKKLIQAPMSVTNSLIYGFTSTAKEAATELYAGRVLNAFGAKRMAKAINRTPLGKALKSKPIQAIIKGRNKGVDMINKSFGGVPGTKLVGSNLEEMFEEILVQATPEYGQNWEQFSEQFSELGSADFYAKVAAQTLLMNKSMQVGGLGKKYYNIATMDKGDRAKYKEMNNLYKELSDRTLDNKKFNDILMNIGTTSTMKKQYDNKIAKLRSDGKTIEADLLEQDKIFQQAVAAQGQGNLDKFKKSLTKAKYNKNLSPSTIANIERLRTEIDEISNDDERYINSKEVVGLKAKARFSKRVIDNVDKEILSLDNQAINDEIDNILQKKIGVEDSYSTVAEDNPALQEYLSNNFENLSEDLQRKLLLDAQKKSLEQSYDDINKKVKKVTSYDHQTHLLQEQKYLSAIEKINKEKYNRVMTSSEFKSIIADKSLQKRGKKLGDARLNELHETILSELERQEEEKFAPQEPVIDTEPVTPSQEATGNALNNVVANQAQTNPIVAKDKDDLSDVIIVDQDDFDFMPSDNTINSFTDWANIHKAEEGKDPVFEDFFNDAVSYLDGDKSKIGKTDLKAMGLSWEASGLGKSNWEKIYADNYTDKKQVTGNLLNQYLNINPQTPTDEESEEQSGPQPTNVGINPLTGMPLKVTPVTNKTSVLTTKGNFNTLDYQNNKEITNDTDGNKIIVYTKEDTNSIPTMNEDSFLDIKELLHPDKNNIGSIWKPVLSNEEDWGDERLKVSITLDNGEITEFVSFPEWIRRNQPSGLTLEQFKQTDAYISKVPMYYLDGEGNKVSFIADTDWYNPLNVRDTSKKIGDVVFIDNPTDHHMNDIQEGKNNTFNLRKQIVDGIVKEVKVESKDGSPWIPIPRTDEQGNRIPPKSLSQVAPDSKIVFFKGDYFVNLDGSTFDMKNNKINNLETLKKVSRGSYRNYYLSPVNKSEDGQQRWVAIEVQRVNEKGDIRAFDEDIETAKNILAANQVLSKKEAQRGLTLQEAESIQNQIKVETGLDINNYSEALNLVNSLIALEEDTGDIDDNGNPVIRKHTAFSKNIKVPGKNGTYFIDALFADVFKPVQNTNLSVNKSAGISIKREGNGFKVKKLADTYEEFLKTRLFTNKMSYNMGTNEEPAYTHSVQPIVGLEPILSEKPTVVEKIQNVEVTEVTEDTTLQDENQKALNLIAEFGGIEDIEDELDGDMMLPVLESVDEINESLNIIPGLTLDQQSDIVNYLLATISKNYDNSKTMTVKDFRNLIKQNFDGLFRLAGSKLTAQYNNLNEVYQKNPQAFPQASRTLKILELKNNKVDAVLNNYDSLFSKAYLEGMRKGFIPSTVKSNEELQEELTESFADEMNEKSLYKDSNEVIHKDKISKKLRRLFATISNGNTGFLGVDKYENYDVMYNSISTLLISPLPTEANFDSMISRMKLYNKVYPWMQPIIDNLEKADDETKNSFVSNMYKYAANASFVAFTDQIDGMNSEIWFSNANNVKQKIKEHFNNEFKRSNITNNNTLNTEKLKRLYNQYESWGEDKWDAPETELRQWLKDFGLSISDGTWEALQKGQLVTGSGANKVSQTFEMLFKDQSPNDIDKRGDRLFSNLAKYAKKHKDNKQGELDFTQNDNLIPFKDMNNIMKSLIEIEAKYNKTHINVTRRDGDKTVSEMIFPNFFLHNVRKLLISAENKDGYLDELSNTSFSKNSTILDLLKNNVNFASIFSYGETGLMSMKKIGSKNPSFAKVDQLSPVDYMFHQRSMFQYMKVDAFEHKVNGFDMRVATMSTPTNSDKGRMMLMKTAVYNLFNDKTAFIKQGNDYNFSPEVKELLYESLIVPELNRIVEHSETNIKDYNKGAVRFNLIPEVNTMSIDGIPVIDYLVKNKDVTKFKELYFDDITTFLETSIKNEAKESLEKTSQFIEKDDKGVEKDKLNNKDYLDQRKDETVEEKRYLAELDYTINSMISNMTTMQLIAGDPAIYYKSKGTHDSIDTNEQIKVSKDLGTNLGKRLALMIAPGTVLSESQDEQYLQLFLKDSQEVASNAEEIIGWHYGKNSLKEEFNGVTYQQIIDKLRNKEYQDDDDPELKQLRLRFDKVKDFLSIETTDAQEYTTLREHLRTIEGQGRISKEKMNDIIDKSKRGETLSKDDIELVLQPIKPVYTGDKIENGVRRIMYIKSSSFPLIPDLVNGTKLEPLMRKMNEIEDTHGYNVRASYQSANKVGAMSNPINPLSQESLNSLDETLANEGKFPDNSLLLDRINFKIQQDVPFKSDLQNEDKVSMGTQIFKLLFGDGITNINGFELDGKKINGKELKEEFFRTFSSIVDMQKTGLLDELGLDDNYESDNPLETAKKIQSLLKAEAEERGFNENDIKSLELETKQLSNGNQLHHFKLPLWFSGNSNKFEAMLNAIINNKIFKQKMPGNSFVVGSENGLTIKEGVENANDIVYIGDYRGGELKGTEVLAPSKIKMNGKIIDLFKKNKNGKYIYIRPQDGGFVINEKTIDPALFENFTFRTPTSSHGSASNIKIVGFLPTVSGDLMITPKNFIAQMGQDFDIDKLTSYQYHFYDNQGRFEKFNSEHKNYMLYEFKKKLKKQNIKGTDIIDEQLLNDVLDIQGFKDINEEELTDILFSTEDLQSKYNKLERKLNMKLAQNRFIEIHNSVYKNPSSEVQKKINKALSMDFAEKQADAIDNLVSNNSTSSFNILSPTYQMDKMIAGSTGSSAIGIYAKGVTFNSLAQQANQSIQIQESYKDEENVTHTRDKQYVFGNIVSDGSFGQMETISSNEEFEDKYDLRRRTAEVQDERVNTATDNEKAQILGRVGITHIDAVAVDNFLSILGIDAERNRIKADEYDESNPFHKTKLHNGEQIYYTEYSIPYLLHSQPIIKEYFTRLKNAKGITQEYKEGIDETLIDELLGLDDEGNPVTKTENYDFNFTGENLVGAVKSNSIDTDFQKQVLLRYKDLIADAKKVKELQDVVDMSNLGKSMWELKDKIEKFQALVDNDDFTNIEELLGTFSKESGLLDIGDGMYFTPKTNQGMMVGTAISLGRNLFFDYFPYYNSYISGTIDNIIEQSGFKGNEVQFKETIFQEIKKYITSATRNGLFLNSPTQERTEMFFDREDNTSLSTYIANQLDTEVKDDNEYKKGLNTIKNNAFLTYLSYQYGENKKPSLIKFDNTEIANVSEEHFHQAFRELMVKDIPLPPKNGKPYSTRMLAQEMVAYSHLSGGIVREAIEFHRFIPIEYYNAYNVTVSDSQGNQKTVSGEKALQKYDTLVSNWGQKERLKNFVKQFFQNNPEKATQYPKEYQDKYITVNDGILTINDENAKDLPKYVSIKNKTKSKLKQDKWSLYARRKNNTYSKIDVLGEFGMSEYDYDSNNLKSSINTGEVIKKEVPVGNIPVKPVVNKGFTIQDNEDVKKVLQRIANTNVKYNPNISSIAQTLLQMFKDKTLDINLKVINDANAEFQGRYNNDTLTINLGKGNKTEETFVHEFVHGVTVREIKQYYNPSWTNIINDSVPKEVLQLNILYKEYIDKISKANPEEYSNFLAKYEQYKNKEKVTFTPRELSVFYPTVNIKEFLAVSLSNNNDFLQEAAKIPYKKSGMNIAEKFMKVLNDLLTKITGVENNLAEQILASSLQTIDALHSKKSVVPQQEMDEETFQQMMRDAEQQPNIFGETTKLGDLLLADGVEITNLPDCI